MVYLHVYIFDNQNIIETQDNAFEDHEGKQISHKLHFCQFSITNYYEHYKV